MYLPFMLKNTSKRGIFSFFYKYTTMEIKSYSVQPKNNKKYWLIWEYRNITNSEYTNHKVFRMNTITEELLKTKIKRVESGKVYETKYRWTYYKTIGQVKKPLVVFN